MKRATLRLLVTVAAVAHVGSSEAQPATPGTVAESYIRCAGASDSKCALELFHFPGTSNEQEPDRRFLKYALELFTTEFGKPEEFHPVQEVDAAFVSAGGGTLPYWQAHQQFRRFQFSVRFEREGPGFIIVDICEIFGRPEIRQVQYGLPRKRADTPSRLEGIMRRLQSFGSTSPT